MTTEAPTVGSLFTGYGGLDLALEAVLGARTIWTSDVCKVDTDGTVGHHTPHRAPCTILAHRFPDAPNLGDITKIDWATVTRPDILAGGFPCQDVSTAGKRAGLRPDTRSGLWTHMAYAIDQLRPRLVVIENVRGLLSAEAHSDLGSRPDVLDGLRRRRRDEPLLRALGAVLGDLADIGYDARWVGLPASAVGFAHGRFRVFVVAHPQGHPWRLLNGDVDAAPVPAIGGPLFRTPTAQIANGGSQHPDKRRAGGHGPTLADQIEHLLPTPMASSKGPSQAEINAGNPKGRLETAVALMPTPKATDGTKGSPNQRGSKGDLMLPSAVAKLLPTPAVNDMGAGKTPDQWDAWTAKMKAAHGNGNGHGDSLHVEALRLDVADRFGDYGPAVARQETIVGRPAPDPTEPAPKGGRRLSARFDEWLMGLTDGWVTDVPGITWQQVVKACGNGVIPQQAATAIRYLLTLNEDNA